MRWRPVRVTLSLFWRALRGSGKVVNELVVVVLLLHRRVKFLSSLVYNHVSDVVILHQSLYELTRIRMEKVSEAAVNGWGSYWTYDGYSGTFSQNV